MADWATVIPTGIAGAGAAWLGQVALSWVKNRGDANRTKIVADTDLEKHRDSLTFELLSAARSEVSAVRNELSTVRSELEKLRPLETHFYLVEQALDHIEALLNPTQGDRANIERSARAFVKRLRRMAEARGTLANEVQRIASSANVAERAAHDGLKDEKR